MRKHPGATLVPAVALAAAFALPGPAGAQTAAADTSRPAPAAAPSRAETRYTLVQVGGRPLPVEIEKEWRCREEVTAGTLALRDDGRWRFETATRETCGDRVKTDYDDDDGIYRAEGSTLRFLDDDGREHTAGWSLDRDLDLDDLTNGTVGEGGALSVRLADEKTVLQFRREAE